MSVKIIHGDCREVLKTLPSESVHTIVTSPPYWGLRDYGVEGQLGIESTPAEYVEKMVAVFREVRRVLRDDGTLWLNLGDSYAGSGRGGHVGNGSSTLQGSIDSEQECRRAREVQGSQLPPGLHTVAAAAGVIGRAWVPPPAGLKQKDLVGIPWMVAFALRADGWYLRQDIIWSKPNPMPESVRDRCTKAHEYLFLLAKSERYYFDQDAILEPASPNTHARLAQNGLAEQRGSDRVPGKTNGPMKAVARKDQVAHNGRAIQKGFASHMNHGGTGTRKLADVGSGTKNNASFDEAMAVMPIERNKRSVWTVTTQPFKEAHFATFPPALIEPCVLAGCPAGGTILDPFFGAGTTGLVADRLGRDCIGIELNPEYVEMARKRIAGDAPLFAEVE